MSISCGTGPMTEPVVLPARPETTNWLLVDGSFGGTILTFPANMVPGTLGYIDVMMEGAKLYYHFTYHCVRYEGRWTRFHLAWGSMRPSPEDRAYLIERAKVCEESMEVIRREAYFLDAYDLETRRSDAATRNR